MATERSIILTRDAARNRIWAEALTGAGIACVDLPLIRFEKLPLPQDLDPAAFDWLLFTSPQGVRAFLESCLTSGAARLGALGAGTAAALRTAGFAVDFDPQQKDGAAFAREFCARFTPPSAILLPGPDRRMDEPVAILAEAGFTVRELPLYRTVPVEPADLPAGPCGPGDVVFFCSPSTVRAFTAAWESRPDAVAIGETTARACREAGFAVTVAATPDLRAMVRAAGLDPSPLNANLESEP
ncbi:MAG: uroporphyrinogen-III synthase [Candidatus Krumholzibacteriia bacterium]